MGDVVADPAPSPPLTVAFSLVKGDRNALVVQKLTELGADRSARLRDSQRRSYEAQVGGIVVDVPQGPLRTSVADDAAALDLPALFGRTAPVVVEIGCGPGDSLGPMAGGIPGLG